MYKLCKTEQSAKRQAQFEESLLSLMQAHSYRDITVQQLCEHTQIPRNAFYRYFDCKDDVLDFAIDHHLIWDCTCSIRLSAKADHFSSLQEMEQVFTYWESQRALIELLERDQLSGRMIERIVAHCKHEKSNIERMYRKDNPTVTNFTTTLSIFGMLGVLLEWHREKYAHSSKEMALLTFHLLTEPIYRCPELYNNSPNIKH